MRKMPVLKRMLQHIRKLQFLFFRRSFIGEINGKVLEIPIHLNSKQFGKSTKLPTILEINVANSDQVELLEDVGKRVRNIYFDMDFMFNVCFSCSKPRLFGPDLYADPYSIWFNVFFGYYEINMLTKERGFPFGYDSELKPNPEEIVKILKSDWNFFSNNLYGVPQEMILPDQLNVHQEEIDAVTFRTIEIADMSMVEVTVPHYSVVSGYVAQNGEELTDNFTNKIWQLLFGFPRARPEFPKSFIPCDMKAVLYLFNTKGKCDQPKAQGQEEWSTFVFGSIVNNDYPANALKNPSNKKTLSQLTSENKEFLQLQQTELKRRIPAILSRKKR